MEKIVTFWSDPLTAVAFQSISLINLELIQQKISLKRCPRCKKQGELGLEVKKLTIGGSSCQVLMVLCYEAECPYYLIRVPGGKVAAAKRVRIPDIDRGSP